MTPEGDPSMTEPTEPRTHHTTVRHNQPLDKLFVFLPDDWPTGVVTVSTVPPDGLWPGPDGTWLAQWRNVPEGWEWLDLDRWMSWERLMHHPRIWVQVRPVPAPEPATVRVPWWEAKDRMLMWAGSTCGACVKVSLDGYGRPKTWYVDGADECYITADDDGMVTVLRDADPTPTDTPSEAPPSTQRRVDFATDDDPANLRPVRLAPVVEDDAPSVVPADSPDTGRPSDNRWLLDDDDEPWFNRAGDYRVYRLSDLDDDDDGCVEAKAALVALVRRDRPQPTAEQVELHYLRQLLHAVDVGINALMADLPGTTESALAVMRHARDTAQAAVVACRTTEGTGE